MKRSLLTLPFFLFFLTTQSWAAPLEFYAKVVEIVSVDSLNTTLTLEITPSVEINVAVTTRTDIKDAGGDPMSIDLVEIGDLVEVEALYTGEGFLALEIQLQGENDGFEIKGFLESVQITAPQSVRVQGLDILVLPETRITNQDHEIITLEDLAALLADAGPSGLPVKVEGHSGSDGLAASEVKVLPLQRFARISLEGTILEVLSETQFLLELGGGTQVLVNILPETEILGEPVAGLFVKVIGQLAPNLSVNALRIRVLGLFELSPDELELDFGHTRSVSVLLRQPLEQELVLQIEAADPEIVSVSTNTLTIPAGELSASFEVTAADTAGKSAVLVSAGAEFGSYSRRLKVEVGEDADEPKELELMWTPRVVRAAPLGRVTVQLMLKFGKAPEGGLPVELELEDASDDLLIRFPNPVTIPAGERTVGLELLFGSQSGSGKLVATLPEEAGGDSAELDIDLRSNSQAPMSISWSERKMELAPTAEGTIELRLGRITDQPVDVVITPVGGKEEVLGAYPSVVTIPAGEQAVEVAIQASDKTGRVKLRAALPIDLGGRHADLDIRVE